MDTSQSTPEPVDTRLLPPSTLVMGPGGTGKTSSIHTLMLEGIHVFMLATEPSAPNRVVSWMKQKGISMDLFDWYFLSPSVPSWDNLRESAKIINTSTLKEIADMRSGVAKPDATRWMEMIDLLNNFKSQKNGREFGDVVALGPEAAFVIDGFTGMSTMSRNLTVGLKPNPNPGEWGVMQQNLLTVIKKLCADCTCFFVLISHIEREHNEITGIANLTVSTLGAKLAPKIPPEFTNVVYAKRIGEQFFWSTADSGVDTKNGDLPLRSDLEPTFKPIVEAYRERLKSAGEAQPTPAPQPEAKAESSQAASA